MSNAAEIFETPEELKRSPQGERIPEVGSWILVTFEPEWHEDGKEPWTEIACVMHVGSNHVIVETPLGKGRRIHFDDLGECDLNPDATAYIAEKVDGQEGVIRGLQNDIRLLCESLGVAPQAISAVAESTCSALAVRGDDPDAYKLALRQAQEDLPALFSRLKDETKTLSRWMGSDLLPAKANLTGYEDAVSEIKRRIYTVDLYAGLSEVEVLVREGDPAPKNTKLKIFQQKCFMDEECLANYDTGGMEFRQIDEFDAWLARPDNFGRLLPHERCMVAFQVRRNAKDRHSDGTIQSALINARLAELDKMTFLYVRNGDRLTRFHTDFDFKDKIFPDRNEFDPTAQLYAEVSVFGSGAAKCSGVVDIHRYEDMIERYDKAVAEHARNQTEWREWAANHSELLRDPENLRGSVRHAEDDDSDEIKALLNEGGRLYRRQMGSHGAGRDPRDEYAAIDPAHIAFDEMEEYLQRHLDSYNFFALILQGLFDRSDALHPHPRVNLWKAESFAENVELIYSHAGLYAGEEPDIEEYLQGLRDQIEVGSVVHGQQRVWAKKEIEKPSNYCTWRKRQVLPDNNPGPGKLRTVTSMRPRSRACTFHWARARKEPLKDVWSRESWPPIACKIDVPIDELFNVSAYKPGDYKLFFADPRTREKYLRWAPLLLMAEEFHAGNIETKDAESKSNMEAETLFPYDV